MMKSTLKLHVWEYSVCYKLNLHADQITMIFDHNWPACSGEICLENSRLINDLIIMHNTSMLLQQLHLKINGLNIDDSDFLFIF